MTLLRVCMVVPILCEQLGLLVTEACDHLSLQVSVRRLVCCVKLKALQRPGVLASQVPRHCLAGQIRALSLSLSLFLIKYNEFGQKSILTLQWTPKETLEFYVAPYLHIFHLEQEKGKAGTYVPERTVLTLRGFEPLKLTKQNLQQVPCCMGGEWGRVYNQMNNNHFPRSPHSDPGVITRHPKYKNGGITSPSILTSQNTGENWLMQSRLGKSSP